MLRQTLIEESKFAVDEIQDAAVFVDHGFEEHPRLLAHGLAQVLIEIGETVRIGLEAVQIA